MEHSYNELYHYGVKGMKWGVRRSKEEARAYKQAYRKDKRVRRMLENSAYDSGQFSKQYDTYYKIYKKSYDKQVAKDKAKTGKISDKTKEYGKTVSQLKTDRDTYRAINKYRVKQAQQHVDSMLKKYPDKKVKDLKVEIKKGETYVNSFNSKMDNFNVSYTLRSRYDSDGTHRYVPVKVIHT